MMQKPSSTLTHGSRTQGMVGCTRELECQGHGVARLGLHVKHTVQVISNAYESLRTTINTIKIPLLAKERKPLASLRRPSFISLLSSSYKYSHAPSTTTTQDLS